MENLQSIKRTLINGLESREKKDQVERNPQAAAVQLDYSQLVQDNLQPKSDLQKMRVTDLHVGFDSDEILRNVSVSFPANQITALLGATGSGKTTLLRTLNRLSELMAGFWMSGTVMLDGLDIYHEFPDIREVRRQIGMLFQRPNPFPAAGLPAHLDRLEPMDRSAGLPLYRQVPGVIT